MKSQLGSKLVLLLLVVAIIFLHAGKMQKEKQGDKLAAPNKASVKSSVPKQLLIVK